MSGFVLLLLCLLDFTGSHPAESPAGRLAAAAAGAAGTQTQLLETAALLTSIIIT